MASVISQPNNTLYVSNIDWKIKKPLLRRALYSLMTRHGKVSSVNRKLYSIQTGVFVMDPSLLQATTKEVGRRGPNQIHQAFVLIAHNLFLFCNPNS